eukprot:scaffold2752_cov393-Prasinococcus_capsulatus_cf.AAC.10
MRRPASASSRTPSIPSSSSRCRSSARSTQASTYCFGISSAYAMWTGYIRPGTLRTGQSMKKAENCSPSRVADVMTTRGWLPLELRILFLRSPNRTSVFRLLSCASSSTMTEYLLTLSSSRNSRSRHPSVMYLILVALQVRSSKRMLYPTSRPSSTLISLATRRATDTAATRRGCVTAIVRPSSVKPALTRNWLICVVFPDPVSAITTVTGFSFTSSTMRCSYCRIGSGLRITSSPVSSSRAAELIVACLGRCAEAGPFELEGSRQEVASLVPPKSFGRDGASPRVSFASQRLRVRGGSRGARASVRVGRCAPPADPNVRAHEVARRAAPPPPDRSWRRGGLERLACALHPQRGRVQGDRAQKLRQKLRRCNEAKQPA